MSDRETLEAVIRSGHFVRAAHLAGSLEEGAQVVRELQLKAIWQMAAIYRNQPGTRRLADHYGLSLAAVLDHLRAAAAENPEESGGRFRDPCYDQTTGKYLAFDDWLEQLERNWSRLSEA